MKLFINISIGLLLSAVVFTGCKQSMVISRVDYSQSIESVLTPNEQGFVNDLQHGIKFNILPLQYAETHDTSSVSTKLVRLIRSQKGFYFVTAPGYNHVYVMFPEKGKLVVENKIKVTDNGIAEPAFNQRMSFIQLLDLETGESWMLTVDGIKKEKSKGEQEG